MPTYSFTRTLPQFQKLVLRKLRVIAANETPDADDTTIVNEALDLRLKELHKLGVLWFNVAGSATELTLTAGVASLSLASVTDFLFPVSVRLRISGEDYPVDVISHEEYQAIQSKADRGEPEKVFFSGATAYFWPTPDDDYSVELTYQAIAADTSSPDAPDVETSMLRSLVTLVASDCSDDFGIPEQRLIRLKAEAQAAERTFLMLNTRRVDSTPVGIESF